jgi:hypothetical protein
VPPLLPRAGQSCGRPERDNALDKVEAVDDRELVERQRLPLEVLDGWSRATWTAPSGRERALSTSGSVLAVDAAVA